MPVVVSNIDQGLPSVLDRAREDGIVDAGAGEM
jgi:hypothetical protein